MDLDVRINKKFLIDDNLFLVHMKNVQDTNFINKKGLWFFEKIIDMVPYPREIWHSQRFKNEHHAMYFLFKNKIIWTKNE